MRWHQSTRPSGPVRAALSGAHPGPKHRVLLLAIVGLLVLLDAQTMTLGDGMSRDELTLHALLLLALTLFAWWPPIGAGMLLVAWIPSFGGPYAGLTTLALSLGAGLVISTCHRWVVVAYGVAYVGVLVALRASDPSVWDVGGLSLELAIAAVSATVGLVGRRLRRRSQRLARELELAEIRAEAARRDERLRIGDELHDSIVRDLTAIVIQAGVLTRTDDDALRDEAAEAVRLRARAALADVRRLLLVVRDGSPPDEHLQPPPRIDEKLRALAGDSGPQAQVSLPGGVVPDLPTASSAVLARVLDEALTNAASHSPGQRVDVVLAVSDGEDCVLLTVTNALPSDRDDVRPEAAELVLPKGGYGLARLREQADVLGGSFEAGVTDAGWRVAARVPLDRSR